MNSSFIVRSFNSFASCAYACSGQGTAHAARLYFWYRAAAFAGLGSKQGGGACGRALRPFACAALAGLALGHGLRWRSYFPVLACCLGAGPSGPRFLPALPWPFSAFLAAFSLPSVHSTAGGAKGRESAFIGFGWLAWLLIRRRPGWLPLLRLAGLP